MARTRPLRLIPLLHRATHRVGLHIVRRLGVTQAEAHVLQHLAVAGDSTVGDLHRAFAHRRSTLTSVLDRLAEAALIVRAASDVDRRTFVIGLTPKGRIMAGKVHAELRRVEAEALGRVGPRDAAGYAAVLAALEAVLQPRAR